MLVICVILGACAHSVRAAEAIFVGPREAGRLNVPLADAALWHEGRLPSASDSARFLASAELSEGQRLDLVGLVVSPAGGLRLAAGSCLEIDGDAQVSYLEVLQEAALAWEGLLLVESSASKAGRAIAWRNAREFRGRDLRIGVRSQLQVGFSALPRSPEDFTKPFVRLSGRLELEREATVVVRLTNRAENDPLPRGEYILVEAAEIVGPLPNVEMESRTPNSRFVLRMEARRLVLSVD